MRYLQYMLFCILILLGLLPLSAANVPLTLTASADHDVLLTTPRQIRRGLQDTPRLSIETAKVTLTFTNTGDEPLKLNTYDLQYSRLQLSITGPDEGSVVLDHDIPLRDMASPRPADFPDLQPGASWTMSRPISFPNDVIGNTCYVLQHTGVYHLRFIYAFMLNKAVLWNNIVSSDGAFQGAIASNIVSLKLIDASEPVNGLQIGLDAGQSTDLSSGDMTFTAYLRNVSDKPITVNAWNLSNDGLQLAGDNGKLLPVTGARYRSAMPTLAERYCTLAPGEQHAFPQRAAYHPTLDTLTKQVGNLNAVDSTGMFRNRLVEGNSVSASALLISPVVPEADAPTPLWVGKVTSPTIVVPFNATAYRQARLKQEVANFELGLDYTGDQPKPYYALHLQMQPEENDGTRAFYRTVVLATPEALALIDYLAKSGVLRDATPGETAAAGKLRHPDGYNVTITGNMRAAGEDIAFWKLPLGWDLATYRLLQALRAQLPAHGQPAMDTLLAQLSGMHDQWLANDALRQPAVTLDTPAGTLSEVARAIVATLNCPGVQLTIDTDALSKPVPAFHFFNVSAVQAFQSLATAANVNFTATGPKATLSSLKLIVD